MPNFCNEMVKSTESQAQPLHSKNAGIYQAGADCVRGQFRAVSISPGGGNN